MVQAAGWRYARGTRGRGAHGTVGAVALDVTGSLAATTSTGGTFGQLEARIGFFRDRHRGRDLRLACCIGDTSASDRLEFTLSGDSPRIT